MDGFRAIGLFLLGAVGGCGIALVAVAHLLYPGQTLRWLDSVNAFVVGALLVAFSLIGGIAIAKRGRTQLLRTALSLIALLALLLGGYVAVRRRADHLSRLMWQHHDQVAQLAKRRSDLTIENDSSSGAMALLRLMHWHRGMKQRYRLAACQPWLPVPPLVPCDCRECAVPGSSGNEAR